MDAPPGRQPKLRVREARVLWLSVAVAVVIAATGLLAPRKIVTVAVLATMINVAGLLWLRPPPRDDDGPRRGPGSGPWT
jgi:hypothetical protein